jgi:hypothetical protein
MAIPVSPYGGELHLIPSIDLNNIKSKTGNANNGRYRTYSILNSFDLRVLFQQHTHLILGPNLIFQALKA